MDENVEIRLTRAPHPIRSPQHPRALELLSRTDAALVYATDALEFLLSESMLAPETPARHLTPLDSDVYYVFGDSSAMNGWSLCTDGNTKRRIEGVYLQPTTFDAMVLPKAHRLSLGLLPATFELWRISVVEIIDGPANSHVRELVVAIQDRNETIDQIIMRTITANTNTAQILKPERIDGLLRHLAKLWLYISGSPIVSREEPGLPTPSNYRLPSVSIPVPTLRFGPAELEKLLSPKVMHDQTVATWQRGYMRTQDLPSDSCNFLLRWEEPALKRVPPMQSSLKF